MKPSGRLTFTNQLGGAWKRARVMASLLALSACGSAFAAQPAAPVPPAPGAEAGAVPAPAACAPVVPNAANCPDGVLPNGQAMPAPVPSITDGPLSTRVAPMQPLTQGPLVNQNLIAATGPRSFAPNMIGDFFGPITSTTNTVIADRLVLIGTDYDSYDTIGGPDSTFTIDESGTLGASGVLYPSQGALSSAQSLGAFLQNGGDLTTLLAGTTPAGTVIIPGESLIFRSTISASDAAALVNANPGAVVPGTFDGTPTIVTDSQPIFQSRTGLNGEVIPDSSSSGTLLDDDFPGLVVSPAGQNDEGIIVFAYDYVVNLPSTGGPIVAAPGANVGRMKLTENTSPLPRDRVYVNYSYFNNTPLFQGGVNVNRVTPGFEKTFLDGQASFEFRTPFASTLDSDISTEPGLTNTSNTEFGNITMYLKGLLWSNETLAISSGLGVAVPTANDFTVRDGAGNTIVNVNNESVHLLPFIGFVGTPTDRFFYQGIMQFDVDANGNTVQARDFATGSLVDLGSGTDQTYLFLSGSAGYWMYLNQTPGSLISGVAPIVEYHLNQSIGGGDSVSGLAGSTFYNFGAPSSLSQSNAVIGLTTLIRNDATLTAGYATPLTSSDRGFDGEFRLMFNWFFGSGVNRMSRVQF